MGRSSGFGSGQFGLPFDVATDTKGNVYAVDYNNHLVQKFDRDGNFLTQWGGLGSGREHLNHPVGIATDKDDNIYVVPSMDRTPSRNSARLGIYLASFGGYGLGPDQTLLSV